MKIITMHDMLSGIAERWRGIYQITDGKTRKTSWISCLSGDSKHIYDQLCTFGSSPSIQQLESVGLNNSWIYPKCNECGKFVLVVVQLGDEPDYESNTASVCPGCLRKAVRLAKGVR